MDILRAYYQCFKLLRVLDLHSNCITGIPPEVGDLKMLEELYLHNSIRENVEQDWLNVTQVHDNKLTSIPAHLCKCTSLRMIDVTHNFIRTLPAEIGLLTELRSLKLSYNKLSHLPPDIGNLVKLKYVNDM
jgi:Leucine-rich repeat (LRR) protein